MRDPLSLIAAALALALAPIAARSAGDEEAEPAAPCPWSGEVSAAGKYNSNFELASGRGPEAEDGEEEIEQAGIAEVAALLRWTPVWSSPWHLAIEAFATTDLHVAGLEDSWVVGRGDIDLGYTEGAGTIGLLEEARYYSEPDDTEFDNLHNDAALLYRHAFSDSRQLRIAWENGVRTYTRGDLLLLVQNDLSVEARTAWRPEIASYLRYAVGHHLGGYESEGWDPLVGAERRQEADLSGMRWIGELGLEALLGGRTTLLVSYSFLADATADPDVWQAGRIQGEEDSLEIDAELNCTRHRATLLASHRFDDRFTLSSYHELARTGFFDRPLPGGGTVGREDLRYLGSVWLAARVGGGLFAEVRYVLRVGRSSIAEEEFTGHVAAAGLEYRF